MDVYHTVIAEEYYTTEGCHIIEVLNTSEHPDSSIARARVEVGVTTQLHALTDTTEIYYIQSGEGVANIDGIEKVMRAGDCIVIPPAVPQQIRNTGEEELIFLCVCQPRFQAHNYKIVSI